MTTVHSIRTKAFTLLEMVAVLVLVLVLAGIAVPTYQAVIGETREDAAVLSAKAFRNSIDAYAASQNVAPDELASALMETPSGTLAAELPDNATTTVDAGVVTLKLEFGSDDKYAQITLATVVGGSSTVASYTPPTTWTFAHVGNTRTVTITGTIGTVTFSTGTSFYLDGLTLISETTGGSGFPPTAKTAYVGLSQDGTESYAGADQGIFLRAKNPDGSLPFGATCNTETGAGGGCGAIVLFSTSTSIQGYRIFTDFLTIGQTGTLEAAAGRYNGSAWVPTSDYVTVGSWIGS
jgi:prepilin-type N-terminal cleavage/methylation domain-containing protein